MSERARVVIAGGGVAGLEALLALRAIAPDHVSIDLVSPDDEFTCRPLQVAEPFGLELETTIDLAPVLSDCDARHIRGSLLSVDPARRTATTEAGLHLGYDALLIAPGARPTAALPGAVTFGGADGRRRFGDILAELGHRGVKRVAFVVPPAATWSIAAYELALLTAAERDSRALRGVELSLVTHESRPLEVFGDLAAALVEEKLADARVAFHGRRAATEFARRELRFRDGDPIRLDRAVSLPRLRVPEIAGIPQRTHGFVHTDTQMRVDGLEHVWAAGDVTAFPIKQGGLAAQQADVAATAIAVQAGARVPMRMFDPVLRAALITDGSLEFLRASLAKREERAAGSATLWWPPAKVAGKYLAPLIARAAGGDYPAELRDLDASRDPAVDERIRENATRALLVTADADAAFADFESALRWLDLVERLNLHLPVEYVTKRYEWRHELDATVAPDRVSRRIDPGLVGPEAQVSDLQRRLGWLRESRDRGGAEMRRQLDALDAGMEHLRALSRQTGTVPR